MKKTSGKLILLVILSSLPSLLSAQLEWQEKVNKGRFYFYWGWNRSTYSQSDIHFSGENYDFTLDQVNASDRQTEFLPKIYFNPKWATIPQYNFRLGYYLSDHWELSFGIDHMKYVMDSYQHAKINGYIKTGGAYDGKYEDDVICINPDFLIFEHTDGLNYINLEARWHSNSLSLGSFDFNAFGGGGGGGLYPKTNATLMSFERHDEFHLAGYGFGAVGGIRMLIKGHFIIQSELKGGWINMPDIRTTPSETDKASQHFRYGQVNIVFGWLFGQDLRVACEGFAGARQ